MAKTFYLFSKKLQPKRGVVAVLFPIDNMRNKLSADVLSAQYLYLSIIDF